MRKIAVLAGSTKQFKEFLTEVDHTDREKFVCLKSRKDIAGIEVAAVIKVGTWWDHPLKDTLLNAASLKMPPFTVLE